MSYITYNNGVPTVWKEPEDCISEWARVKEMRRDKNSLLFGGKNQQKTEPIILPGKGMGIPNSRRKRK